MRLILVLFAIIAAIVVFSYLGQFLTNEGKDSQQGALPQTQENIPQQQSPEKQTFTRSAGSAAIVKPKQPAVLINTYITFGPEEGEIIEETNKVTFEFEARISPDEIKNRVYFETKIERFDDKWISTSAKKRTVVLPPGPEEYTFLVRAKISNDVIDLTPAKRTFEINISPYFGKVKIANVRPQTTSRSSLITLTTRLQKEEGVNITGWKTKSKGGSSTIPLGIEEYLYQQAAKEETVAQRGDTIYLSSARNPLGENRSFRPNKCIGYLVNDREFSIWGFSIPISKSCPKPTREDISHLNPCCQEFIRKVGTCRVPNYYSDPKISFDSECVSYLDANLNYAGCFRNYSKDRNFLGKQWHIYMNGSLTVSKGCDALYLHDKNNLLVDKYSYGQPFCK